jgi:hypothetical protein
MKIAIAGPGRSGTSLLTKILGAWGFVIPPEDGNWHDDAAAGMESRIGSDSGYEVDKDPWAFEYLDRIEPEKLSHYAALLVPIRNRYDATMSRSVQERMARATNLESDHWTWNTWGSVPGGAVVRTDVTAISSTLALGLWDLLDKASSAELPLVFLNFPRFASDFDYLWRNLSPLVGTRLTAQAARAGWEEVVDATLIRVNQGSENTVEDLSARELTHMVEMFRERLRQALTARDEAWAQRDEACAQRDEALRVVDAISTSTIWRFTAPYRRLRNRTS